MLFNSNKNGFENEDEFVLKLNNKMIRDIDFNLQLFIYDIFGNIDSGRVVKCYKNMKLQKYDIVIKIGDDIIENMNNRVISRNN